MSGVLHPVGPEQARTYWVRRAVVVVALVLVVVLLVGLVRAIATPSTPTTAAPAGSSPGPVVTRSTPRADAPTRIPAATATSTPTSSATAAPTSTGPADCASGDLTARIKGAGRVEAGRPVAFALGVVNASDQTCVLTVGPGNIELKIYSGTDRIWSTRDCRTLVRRQVQKAAPDQGVELRLTWNGRRSAAGCRTRPEIPQPGTYFATVQLYGAAPVQQRIIVT